MFGGKKRLAKIKSTKARMQMTKRSWQSWTRKIYNGVHLAALEAIATEVAVDEGRL